MRRHLCHPALLLALTLIASPPRQAAGANAAVQDAVADLQHRNYKGAEQKLRAELKVHPGDAETLSLLGVALDEQQRFPEARDFHKRAMAASPRSTAVLYNYANNLLATGDEKSARDVLLKLVAVDPADRNANLALAQLALNRKDGSEALVYLDHVKDAPDTAILRLTALDLAGKRAEATALFEQLAAATQNDGKLSADYGGALAKAGLFEQAETFLAHAFAADPANFQIMYSLGVTASQAGHNERARVVLEAALRQQPNNVDALYTLAVVYGILAQPESAIRLLAEAGKLAPQRADVQKLTAITARNIKADEDSVAAWERYLKLVPNDDEARRERAFGKARLALLDEALPDLRWFVVKHPGDAVGFYELAMAESVDDPAKAIEGLDHAVQLDADFVAARAARGILLYAANRPEAAVADLEFAVSRIPPEAPERAPMLDRLGQAYAALNRLADAVPALRKAAELAPNDSTTQLHLANALAEAGKTEESEALMARFRQMSPGTRTPKVSGVVDYLRMSLAERHDSYRARLEKTVHDRPDDANSQLLYLKLLLSDSRIPEAIADAHQFEARKPGAQALADAGHALIEAKQYSTAKELLELVAPDSVASIPGLNLDVAIAAFHAAGSGAVAAGVGLRQLDLIPEAGRNAGYHLARAQMLDASGEPGAAIEAMNQAIAAAPEVPDLYWQASALMTKNRLADAALKLLDRAAKLLPREAQIPVIQATVLELTGRTDDARHLLSEAQRRWPEVAAVWVAQGVILAAHQQEDDARKALETAVALGAHSAETYYWLADSSLGSGPEHIEAADAALKQALKITPDDPQFQALAKRIAAGKVTGAAKPADGAPNGKADPSRFFLTTPPRDW